MTKRAVAEITLDASPSEISNALIQIMWASRIKVTKQIIDEQPLRIQLFGETSLSFRSGGEYIKITIIEQNSKSRVIAESETKLTTTLFDLGKNKENVTILINQLIMKFCKKIQLVLKEAVV